MVKPASAPKNEQSYWRYGKITEKYVLRSKGARILFW
jgi:hypothetical protein